jgi:hypothetical protein
MRRTRNHSEPLSKPCNKNGLNVIPGYVILNLFQDLFQNRFQNHIGLMDSGSAAGMTMRVTKKKCHPCSLPAYCIPLMQ